MKRVSRTSHRCPVRVPHRVYFVVVLGFIVFIGSSVRGGLVHQRHVRRPIFLSTDHWGF